MPGKRLSMRKIRQVLRLKFDCHLSNQGVATSCGISRTTVREYVQRATGAGLCWPVPWGRRLAEKDTLYSTGAYHASFRSYPSPRETGDTLDCWLPLKEPI